MNPSERSQDLLTSPSTSSASYRAPGPRTREDPSTTSAPPAKKFAHDVRGNPGSYPSRCEEPHRSMIQSHNRLTNDPMDFEEQIVPSTSTPATQEDLSTSSAPRPAKKRAPQAGVELSTDAMELAERVMKCMRPFGVAAHLANTLQTASHKKLCATLTSILQGGTKDQRISSNFNRLFSSPQELQEIVRITLTMLEEKGALKRRKGFDSQKASSATQVKDPCFLSDPSEGPSTSSAPVAMKFAPNPKVSLIPPHRLPRGKALEEASRTPPTHQVIHYSEKLCELVKNHRDPSLIASFMASSNRNLWHNVSGILRLCTNGKESMLSFFDEEDFTEVELQNIVQATLASLNNANLVQLQSSNSSTTEEDFHDGAQRLFQLGTQNGNPNEVFTILWESFDSGSDERLQENINKVLGAYAEETCSSFFGRPVSPDELRIIVSLTLDKFNLARVADLTRKCEMCHMPSYRKRTRLCFHCRVVFDSDRKDSRTAELPEHDPNLRCDDLQRCLWCRSQRYAELNLVGINGLENQCELCDAVVPKSRGGKKMCTKCKRYFRLDLKNKSSPKPCNSKFTCIPKCRHCRVLRYGTLGWMKDSTSLNGAEPESNPVTEDVPGPSTGKALEEEDDEDFDCDQIETPPSSISSNEQPQLYPRQATPEIMSPRDSEPRLKEKEDAPEKEPEDVECVPERVRQVEQPEENRIVAENYGDAPEENQNSQDGSMVDELLDQIAPEEDGEPEEEEESESFEPRREELERDDVPISTLANRTKSDSEEHEESDGQDDLMAPKENGEAEKEQQDSEARHSEDVDMEAQKGASSESHDEPDSDSQDLNDNDVEMEVVEAAPEAMSAGEAKNAPESKISDGEEGNEREKDGEMREEEDGLENSDAQENGEAMDGEQAESAQENGEDVEEDDELKNYGPMKPDDPGDSHPNKIRIQHPEVDKWLSDVPTLCKVCKEFTHQCSLLCSTCCHVDDDRDNDRFEDALPTCPMGRICKFYPELWVECLACYRDLCQMAVEEHKNPNRSSLCVVCKKVATKEKGRVCDSCHKHFERFTDTEEALDACVKGNNECHTLEEKNDITECEHCWFGLCSAFIGRMDGFIPPNFPGWQEYFPESKPKTDTPKRVQFDDRPVVMEFEERPKNGWVHEIVGEGAYRVMEKRQEGSHPRYHWGDWHPRNLRVDAPEIDVDECLKKVPTLCRVCQKCTEANCDTLCSECREQYIRYCNEELENIPKCSMGKVCRFYMELRTSCEECWIEQLVETVKESRGAHPSPCVVCKLNPSNLESGKMCNACSDNYTRVVGNEKEEVFEYENELEREPAPCVNQDYEHKDPESIRECGGCWTRRCSAAKSNQRGMCPPNKKGWQVHCPQKKEGPQKPRRRVDFAEFARYMIRHENQIVDLLIELITRKKE